MNKRGFTLIELIMVVVIVGVAGGIVLTAAGGCQGHKTEAEADARTFAASMGIKVKGVNCVDRDTDGDGYVSCTVSEEVDGKTRMHAVECASGWTWNSGCRMQKPGVNANSFGQ